MNPHVLFVTVDQWPSYLLGCAGHHTIETPTLDRLAEVGTRFTNTYAQTPICIPSRRSLMTGLTSRGHGDRDFQPSLPMPPQTPTLAGCFRDAGYQTTAIGKLHVYPPRDRIGFDDAILAEEGRGHLGGPDDYEMYLADSGHAGAQFLHGMSNNEYSWRTWHLPEETHVTNWTTRTAARSIRRRDPTRPGFWHVSYTHPHPPIVPLASYLERYARREMPEPVSADWSEDDADMPFVLRAVRAYYAALPPAQLADMRRAYYALCTHVDHQIRLLIGTLREAGLLDDTIIVFTSDHGDMLGDHGLYGKRLMYDPSARVPLLIADRVGEHRLGGPGILDDRLVALHDLMPTMLDMAGVPVPETCEGLSLLSDRRRAHLYGESHSGARASRMVRDERYKLIWYPAGNRMQLFDLQDDPGECRNLADDEQHAERRSRLETVLVSELYGEDREWVEDGRLTGIDAPDLAVADNRGLSGQRGIHYPEVPPSDASQKVGAF
ncbi:sulfatase-like hydrolase/transferase [uncultured Jannaschia sp.]|uniref:sulfatase-like hydrolase/transferase n=1 Tax=uncultured Jannaschia sp. TaxID=293347 RepID=UPI002604D15D|nr:sulfatase-like hydrolase/transferase [uncultured Jannaschia sp.]